LKTNGKNLPCKNCRSVDFKRFSGLAANLQLGLANRKIPQTSQRIINKAISAEETNNVTGDADLSSRDVAPIRKD